MYKHVTNSVKPAETSETTMKTFHTWFHLVSGWFHKVFNFLGSSYNKKSCHFGNHFIFNNDFFFLQASCKNQIY